jgi:glutathione synthase/RimK-type ligase-like ATP-grasp enzyme
MNACWHFDDKIAETYLLESIGAPMPESRVFYSRAECIAWLDRAEYPIVAKLRCGSGSNNVRLLKDRAAAIRYAARMFSRGYDPSPGFFYKAYSKAQSSRNWKTFASRLKKVPEFMRTRRQAKRFPAEKGYCYFQEFIPNDGTDIKAVVVGNKLGFLVRAARRGDFRASGSGDITYDRRRMSRQIIDSAFAACDAIGAQCMGFDYVVDKRNGRGLIVEMSYGFDHRAISDSGGYFDRQGNWHEEPLDVPLEIIRNLYGS